MIRLVFTHNSDATDEEFQLFVEGPADAIEAVVLDLSDSGPDEGFHTYTMAPTVDWNLAGAEENENRRNRLACWSHQLEVCHEPKFVDHVFEEFDGHAYVDQE